MQDPPRSPQVLGGPSVSLIAGVPVNLTCRSRGDARPTPELLWFRDGVRLDGTTFHQTPPEVTLSVSPHTVQEGEKVTFLCQATVQPPVTGYRWAKGGSPVLGARGPRLEVVADASFLTELVSCEVLGSGATLRLPSVGPEDAGDYVCRAEPGLSGQGGGAAEARLTVNDLLPTVRIVARVAGATTTLLMVITGVALCCWRHGKG
ncbi:hypothetical protein H8958_020320 [Nasalis larvatus]